MLLSCEFRITTTESSALEASLPVPDADDWRFEIDEELELGYDAGREGDEFVLVISLRLSEPGRYHFRAVTGARFDAIDEPELAAEDAASTLLFIAYPYLRELVSSITARSPYDAYIMRPLTKLPHPTVRGEDEAAED